MSWQKSLIKDPISALMGADAPSLVFFVQRDLLEMETTPVDMLWELPEARKLLARQQPDGSWRYSGSRPGDDFGEAYELFETWKMLRVLVEMFGFTRQHSAVERACEYILSYQTEEGDIRGILSNQYTPYYMGVILEILIKAGYIIDKHVIRALDWLLEMRQEDGGWIIPLTMFKMKEYYRLFDQPPVPPDKHRPFSHMTTGMVIRGFAAHPHYHRRQEVLGAGELLKGRFFQKDTCTSRQAEAYWFKFQFPFWWTDLLTVMDSLMRMEFQLPDVDIQKGIDWFINNQSESGLWPAAYGGASRRCANEWVSLAICRVLKYFLE